MREWALQRWSESTQVYLARELPRLKMDIRNEREAEARRQLEQDSEAEQAEVLLQVQDDRQFRRKH
jgi:G2/mitotic-specific cyclin 1/2